MKRMISLLLVLVMLLCLAACDQNEDNAHIENQDDDQESSMVSVYLPVASENVEVIEGEECVFRREFFYNEYGLKEKSLNYAPDGSLQSTYEYTYDEDGRLISETYISDYKTVTHTYGYDSRGTQYTASVDGETYPVEFDEEGRVSYCKHNENLYLNYTYEDEYNYTISYYSVIEDAVINYEKFTLDENGHITCRRYYIAWSNELMQRIDYYYYDGDLLIEESVYMAYSEEHIAERISYTYDEYGNCTEITRNCVDGTFSFTVFTIEEVQVRSDSPILD